MIGWAIAMIYIWVGYLAAVELGHAARQRQVAYEREQRRKYPALYGNTMTKTAESDLETFPVVMAVLAGMFLWPLAWPVWRIVRSIINQNTGDTSE